MMSLNAKRLLKYLNVYGDGQENAITKRALSYELSSIYGESISEREIFDLAQEARDAGYPVISACSNGRMGMYLAARRSEVVAYRNQLISRRTALCENIRSCEKILETQFTEAEQLAITF